MSIDTVKVKLSSHTGSAPQAMILQLKDDTGKMMATLTDPFKLLGFYSPYDGCAHASPLRYDGRACAAGTHPAPCSVGRE